jgi:hypothetical protein
VNAFALDRQREHALKRGAFPIDRRVGGPLSLAPSLVSADVGARHRNSAERPEDRQQVRDRIFDAVEGLSPVRAVFGLEILGELGHRDLLDTRRDDAPFDGRALTLLQHTPCFLLFLGAA